jgi:beta-lactamase superfamily II metal-dependent hydrolase
LSSLITARFPLCRANYLLLFGDSDFIIGTPEHDFDYSRLQCSFCLIEGAMKSTRVKVVVALAAFLTVPILLLSLLSQGQAGNTLQIDYIDVGQGDSILLHASDGTDILIDGGPRSAGPTVVAHIQSRGIDDVEVIIVTHDDAEHVGGLIDVLRSTIPVESVIHPWLCSTSFFCQSPTYQEFSTEMQNRGLTPTPVQAYLTYTWGAINSFVVNPIIMPTEQFDENSVVILVVYGDVRFLFTADISSHTERLILSEETLASWVEADVLKVARHGGGQGSSARFLEAVGAELAVISVGADNAYGYPAQETLDRLQAAGAGVLRTDQNGTVAVTTDGQTCEVQADFVVFLPLLTWRPPPTPTPTGTPTPELPCGSPWCVTTPAPLALFTGTIP